MFIDYGRWMALLLTMQFLLLFYLIYKENESVLAVSDTFLLKYLKRYRIQIILICTLMAFLGPVNSITPSNNTMYIFKTIKFIVQQFMV